jgi:hypothetical protein
LIGLRFTLGNWAGKDALGPLTPIFPSTKDQAAEGMSVVAKDGYAVGGLLVDADDHVTALRIIFMKIDKDKLDPKDTYTSDWLGKPSGVEPRKLAGAGAKIIGIHGRQGLVTDAVGVVLEGK